MFKKIFTVVVVSVAITAGSFWVGYSQGKDRDSMYKELDVFAQSLAIIEKKHVDGKSPHDIIVGAMQGMLSSLDAYSQFLTPEDYKDLLNETEGEFGGLGIEIAIKDGMLTVVTAMDDAPAFKAGVESGDIIVKIEDKITRSITISEAVKKLRGTPGTKVKIEVLNRGKTLKDITITREIIKIKDIKRTSILEDGIGYVKIAEFRENTSKDLDVALKDLQNKKMRGLVIDVRNNPGGLLNSAIDIASKFLPNGKTVVSTRAREEQEKFYKATPESIKILDIPIAVLINKGSASGAEILAAAIRENKRGVLVGETSFGKGSVQAIIPLQDGSALRLTTSTYYTPAGICIHEKGIKPDVEVVNAKATDDEDDPALTKATGKIKEEEVFSKVEAKDEKSKDKSVFDYKADAQLMRALDLVKGLAIVSGVNK